MIEEVRIISRAGLSIANVNLGLGSNQIIRERKDAEQSLFAGFISASISMFEELENQNIDEITYHSQKIIIHDTNELFFLGLVNIKVPTKVVERLLQTIARKWEVEFPPTEKLFDITDEMTNRTQKIVKESVEECFWWSKPNYSIENNINLIKDTYKDPSGTFYIRFLPKTYLITAGILWLIAFISSLIFTTTWIGLYTTGAHLTPLYTISTILFMWIGTGIFIEFMDMKKFNLTSYLIVSGIYSIAILPMMMLGGAMYYFIVYDPIISIFRDSHIIVLNIINMSIFYIPFNLSFFGYLLLTGYGSSFTQEMSPRRYLFSYTISVLLALIIATMIGGELRLID
jgi:hypothetical protein